MSSNQTDNRQVSDAPSFSEAHWYSMSIALVIIATVLACFAAVWIFNADDVDGIKARVDIVAPFGAFCLALVTFSTVAWRGMVNSRQADQQRRQNDANDEANYSKLLQEAAKLLADPDKLPQVIAGIASLEILLSEPKQRFALEALDLLGDQLVATYNGGPFDRVSRAVVRGLYLGEKSGLKSRVDGVFRSTQTHSSWAYIPALRSVAFTGGTIRKEEYDKLKNRIRSLTRVSIHGIEYGTNVAYDSCRFHKCRITKIQAFRLTGHTFEECDFSDAVISILQFIDAADFDMKPGANYYKEGRPPVDQDGLSLADRFMTEAEYQAWNDDIPF